MTDTCFVNGDQIVYDEFFECVQKFKSSKTQKEELEDIRKQVREYSDKFSTRIKLACLKLNQTLNVKQLFYCITTLLIALVGKMFEAQSTSCFDIINKLAKLKIITTDTKHNLMLTVATSCDLRLKIHTKEQSQRDYDRNSKNSYTIFHEILKTVDQDSIITYLQVTYWLQREVINVLKIKETHIYSYLSFLITTICYALRLDRLMILLSKKYNKLGSSNISKFAEIDNMLPDNRFNRQEILVENAAVYKF